MGADRNQWQFPKNVAGGILGWRDDGKGMANKVIGEDIQEHSPNLDELATVSPGDAGKSILALSLAADVRNFLDTAPYVETRTALKALDTTKDTVAYLKEDGRQGIFQWTTGDLSAQVAADTAEAIYVKADGVAATVGAWLRIAASDVRAFGASATADSSAAITAMATLLGYVRFPSGGTLIGTDLTIDAPMFFGDAAYIEVASGFTVSLTNTVNAPYQWIFRGDGSVVVPLPDVDSGEDIRVLNAIWFGAFTQVPSNQAPAIQRALDALGNSREGIVMLDGGSYDIESGMTLRRGTKLRSRGGVRQTVLQIKNDGYPVIQTGHTACYIEDIQFENSPTSLTRAFPFIHLKHDFCEVNRVFHQSAFNAIIVDGPNCKISNVEGVYGAAAPGAGSSQILIRAAAVSVEDIYCRFSSGAWPDYSVEVGTGAAGNITAFHIENIEYIGGGVGVYLHADNIAIARGRVKDINARGVSGTQPQVLKLKTTGGGEIFSVPINGVIIPNTATAGITFQQDSTLSIRRVSIDDVQDAGSTGNCIEFIQTAGSINNIAIGSNVQTLRANDITESIGTAGGVYAITCAMRGRRKGKTASFTVPYSGIDDGVTYHIVGSVTITLPNNADGATVMRMEFTSSGTTTLQAAAGATINAGAAGGSKVMAAGPIYPLACTRNSGGSAAEWRTAA